MSDTDYKEFRVEYVARIPVQGRSEKELMELLTQDIVAGTRHDQLSLTVRPRTLEVEDVTDPVPSEDPKHHALFLLFCEQVAQGTVDPDDLILTDFEAKASSINNQDLAGQFDYLVEAYGPEGLARHLELDNDFSEAPTAPGEQHGHHA